MIFKTLYFMPLKVDILREENEKKTDFEDDVEQK